MTGHLEIYPRHDGRWAWRLRAANGRIIATDGSQGYERPGAAHAIATRIVAGQFANVHVTATNHPEYSGDILMSDTTVVKYAVARRGNIVSGLFEAPESAQAELDEIKRVAAGIGINDSLKLVEVDVVTSVSDPRDYEPAPETEPGTADGGQGDSNGEQVPPEQ